MFAISHRKKDGSYVNDEAREKSEELQAQTQLSTESDAYTSVFGKEHPGRVRSMGHGVCPSQMFASTSQSSGSSYGKQKYEIMEKRLEEQQTDFKMKMEAQETKIEAQQNQIKFLMNALVHVMQQTGGSMPPGFQEMFEHQNLGSPAPAQTPQDLRRSSTNSHDPQNQASSSRPPQLD